MRRIVTEPLDNNVYRIDDGDSQASLIVDPAAEPDRILAFGSGRQIVGVVVTHGHWDHHGAATAVGSTLEVPVFLHPSDVELAGNTFDGRIPEHLSVGSLDVTTMHTPGHTPGSTCLTLPGVVLTGDTLFPGGPGATRFDHSDFATIIDSIRTRLFSLDDATVVLPGHGASTTIGTERPHLDEWIERGW
ncbi:MAG: MBL fold metallo-hydrolase [Acidimicrobiia bacterium]|nr:MBL fold metallo-hydrolase [Acidimicrobiia bacterium]